MIFIFTFFVFVLTAGAQGEVLCNGDTPPRDTCFCGLYNEGKAWNDRARGNGNLYIVAIDHFEAARACPGITAVQDEAALRKITESRLNWASSLEVQTLLAKEEARRARRAEDSVVVLLERVIEAQREEEIARLEAVKSGRISEASRLALLANRELTSINGDRELALSLAYAGVDTLRKDSTMPMLSLVATAFGNAAFHRFAEYYDSPSEGAGALGVYYPGQEREYYTVSFEEGAYYFRSEGNDPRPVPAASMGKAVIQSGDEVVIASSTGGISKLRLPGLAGIDTTLASGEWTHLAISQDQKNYVAGGREGQLLFFSDGTMNRGSTGQEGHIQSLEFSDDGALVLVTATDSTCSLWSVSAEKLHSFAPDRGLIMDACINDQGTRIALAFSQGFAMSLDAQSGDELGTMPHEGAVTSVAFNDEGNAILTSACDGKARLWEADGGSLQAIAEVGSGCIGRAGYFDSNTIYTWTYDGHFMRFGEDLTMIDSMTTNCDGQLSDMIIAPDGQHFLAVGGKGTVRLWDESGIEWLSPPSLGTPIWAAGFSPDGSRVWLSTMDGTREVTWICETPKYILQNHSGELRAVRSQY